MLRSNLAEANLPTFLGDRKARDASVLRFSWGCISRPAFTYHRISRQFVAALLASVLCPVSPLLCDTPLPVSVHSSSLLPRDRSFSGKIVLSANATDTRHGIITVRETIPVQSSGDMTLLYSEWETGSHAPTVPLASLAGLVIKVDRQRVEWSRDPLDVHVFRVPVPARSSQVTLELQYFADRGAMRETMLNVPWQRLLLYPAGWSARDIPVAARLRVPDGLTVVTSLDLEPAIQGELHLATTSLERLADAPAYAARYARKIDITPADGAPVWLHLLADNPASLAISDQETERMRALTKQTFLVFGPAPFRHYDAIVALEDASGAGGVEHLEEGENHLPASYFVNPAEHLIVRDLIAHELVHAWNGVFRQPSDLWKPTFNQPVGGSLLWVYEGQTEFWGRVLAARAGLRSRQETLDQLALDAAFVANRPGRAWKSLADSTSDAVYMAGRRVGWRDWQRREDYSSEGVLLWLDVDTRLRELSAGRRGLDDFAARFFHATRPDGAVSTYSFEDVCRTLDAVAHDDWPRFLRRHLDTHDEADAMAGLSRAGWRLIYTAEASETFRQNEAENGQLDLTYSIGAVLDDEGRVASVAWGGPAFQAGLTPGMQITTVAGTPFSRAAITLAIARTPAAPLTMDVANGPERERLQINYRGGPRYPHLERIEGRRDRLSPLLAPM